MSLDLKLLRKYMEEKPDSLIQISGYLGAYRNEILAKLEAGEEMREELTFLFGFNPPDCVKKWDEAGK